MDGGGRGVACVFCIFFRTGTGPVLTCAAAAHMRGYGTVTNKTGTLFIIEPDLMHDGGAAAAGY